MLFKKIWPFGYWSQSRYISLFMIDVTLIPVLWACFSCLDSFLNIYYLKKSFLPVMCFLPQPLSLFTLEPALPTHLTSPQGWRVVDFLTWVSRDDYSEIAGGKKRKSGTPEAKPECLVTGKL